jgi:nitrate/TMAO reductase-like tetraheme cytochrome c subunit
MTASTEDRKKFFGRLFNYANNAITIAGLVLTTISGLLIIVFLSAQLWGGLDNPYIGLFAYVVLPMIFVLGLIEIPIGMWRRRRKLIREGATEEELTDFPRLDFNDPHMRRVWTIVIIMTAFNAVILGAASFFAVEEMETVEFCGETCHTVMQPEFTAYQDSPHSRVACVDCHIGPGASWFVRSKLDGLRQVWRTAVNTYTRPIGSPIHTLRPARETCEQCHWPNKHHGDKLRIFSRYKTDEANTPSYTAMLLRTGGGSLDIGRAGGIHWWHIYSDNRIRYISADERREEIAWVELLTPDGSVRTYTRNGEEPTAEEIEANARIMDCVDCHNRPTHTFHVPAKGIDWIIDTHPELRNLPYFKKQAVKAIEGEYESHAAGMAAVRDTLTAYYATEYPDLAASESELVARGADLAAQAYGKTVFPAMDTNWETHPNHIGHDDFPGCMRCHDDEMSTADGEYTIPMDCETCHIFLLEDSAEYPEFAYSLEGN